MMLYTIYTIYMINVFIMQIAFLKVRQLNVMYLSCMYLLGSSWEQPELGMRSSGFNHAHVLTILIESMINT